MIDSDDARKIMKEIGPPPLPDPDDLRQLWYPKPCANGHTFIWEGSTTTDINAPCGTVCQCGKVIADGNGGYY